LGIGDWGLGIGDWAQSPIPKKLEALKLLIIKKPFHIYFNLSKNIYIFYFSILKLILENCKYILSEIYSNILKFKMLLLL